MYRIREEYRSYHQRNSVVVERTSFVYTWLQSVYSDLIILHFSLDHSTVKCNTKIFEIVINFYNRVVNRERYMRNITVSEVKY